MNNEDENPLVYSTEWPNGKKPKPPIESIKCICCEKVIDRTDKKSKHNPIGDEWNGGMCGRIDANYGSIHDSDVFFIGLCDDCTTRKREDGTLIFRYNYMFDKGDEYGRGNRSTQ